MAVYSWKLDLLLSKDSDSCWKIYFGCVGYLFEPLVFFAERQYFREGGPLSPGLYSVPISILS